MENISPEGHKTEVSVLKFLSKPKVWVILVIIILVGYWFTMLMQNINNQENLVDSDFQTMCEQDLGVEAWMKMIPFRDGNRTSDEPCYGCMADDNNMICSKVEYEQWKMQNKNK